MIINLISYFICLHFLDLPDPHDSPQLDQSTIEPLKKTNFLVFHPERYHGISKEHDHVEGWFFKAVHAESGHPLVVIVGVYRPPLAWKGSEKRDEMS